MEGFVNALIVLLAIIAGTILTDLTAHPTPTIGPAPHALPAAHGWRAETAWIPLTEPTGRWTWGYVNPLGWQWNANPTPMGTDQEWLVPIPEWLHPFHGLGTL